VITSSIVPDVRSSSSRTSVTWLLFCTAQSSRPRTTMPFRLNSPLVSAAGPCSASVGNSPGTPWRSTGTKKSAARTLSVNQAPFRVTVTRLIIVGGEANG
jgi:hypothetical protein